MLLIASSINWVTFGARIYRFLLGSRSGVGPCFNLGIVRTAAAPRKEDD
jgi:hypothetical protein